MGLIGKAARPVILALALALILTLRPGLAIAASPEGRWQIAQQSSEGAPPKSEAAEAWDAVKNTTNPALLEAFIKRYGTTFFAEIAKTRLDELKAAAAKAPLGDGAKSVKTAPIHANPGQTPSTNGFQPSLQMPSEGPRERAALYEEDPTDAKGRQFDGSVVWRTETIKAAGKPDELAAHADVEIPSRGLRLTLLLKRNLDPALPASHVVELKLGFLADVDNRGIANVPGILMKANQQAKGMPLAGLAVKVTDGFFLVGLSNVAADRQRNLGLLLDRAWFDIPIVYANQRRAILAIDKGATGDEVFKTIFAAWGPYPDSTQPEATMPEDRTMPEEWKRSMTGRSKAR